MNYHVIEDAIREITECSMPPPLTVAQPATMTIARQTLERLNTQGIYPEEDIVRMLLAKYNWEEKHIKFFIKRLKKHLQP